MYNMDLQRVLNARLFVSGNYVALLIEGAQGDWQVSDEEQAKFAAEEAVKVDDAWEAIFRLCRKQHFHPGGRWQQRPDR